jgi:hypothetical protein
MRTLRVHLVIDAVERQDTLEMMLEYDVQLNGHTVASDIIQNVTEMLAKVQGEQEK